MEVHAHAHTARKKWTHYLWEFLMLFLAVFCGFLAEYQLEHKIEKERGKQFIRSFYADLKTDTAEFSKPIRRYEGVVSALENRRDCYYRVRENQPDDCLKNLFENAAGGYTDLISADQTIQQLKNAGGLRLLKKQDADSILLYDKMVRHFLRIETTGFLELQLEIRRLVNSLYNYDRTGEQPDSLRVPVLFPPKKTELNNFFNLLDNYAKLSANNLNRLKMLKEKAISLLHYFREKYHFA